MLKDLIITLSLLCLCFMLLIVMHHLDLRLEINLLISTVVLSWGLLQFIDRRVFFQTSIALMIAILLMLQQYQQIFWTGLGLFIGILIYRLPQIRQDGRWTFTTWNLFMPRTWLKKLKLLRPANSDHA